MQQITPLAQKCRHVLTNSFTTTAIEFEGKRYTWSDMRQVADQLAAIIGASNAGPVPEVAFVARNRPSALAAFLGLLAQQCTIRMVYPFQSSESLAQELERIQPQIVVAAKEDFTDSVFTVLKRHHIAVAALTEMGAETYAGFNTTVKSEHNQSMQPQVVLLTSGTTGTPKPFALDYEAVNRYYTGEASGTQATIGSVPAAALLYFPVSNISGLYATLPPLINAVPIVLLDRFDLEQWHAFVKAYKPNVFGLPPAGYKMVLDADIPVADLSSIKFMGAGAAPLDPAVQAEFEQRYGIPVLLSYGATEFGGPVTRMTPDLLQQYGGVQSGSVGRPLDGMKVRVLHPETGRELSAGEEGVVEVVSCRIGPDWIRTSDLGVMDEDGFLFLRGRVDNAIIRGGFKLLPVTIEAALLKNPDIAMVAVVGVGDPRLGQVPAAAIVLKPHAESITIADIEADLRRHLPSTYVPAHWKLLDTLPRTPSMKVDVPQVKLLFAG